MNNKKGPYIESLTTTYNIIIKIVTSHQVVAITYQGDALGCFSNESAHR